MRLGQAHLPWQTRIFDRCCRRRACAAIVTRNQDDVGLGLGHPRGNRANARRRDQLYRYLTARVDLLKIIDQLRQILDRIDVVVRRGRDQRDSLCGMPQPSDQIGHFHTRQLATFTGLGTLGDLDLKLFTMVQVFSCYTKTARSHLFDLGRRVIAIWFRYKMRWIFAAFAGVGFCPDPVHRHVQRFMCLGAQSTQRHAGCHKPFPDGGNAFHLFQRDRFAQRFDIQQIAQVDRRVRPHFR